MTQKLTYFGQQQKMKFKQRFKMYLLVGIA